MIHSRLLLALLVATGCTTLRGRADTAFSNGNYLAAADLYDQIVRAHPDDAGARKRRTEAREAELRIEIRAAQTARAAGHETDAIDTLSLLLARRDAWADRLTPAVAHAIDFEVAAAAARIGGHVAEQISTAGPLAGEHVAAAYARVLSHVDFAETRTALRIQLGDAGHARCEQLGQRATTPYLTWLVARYCEHFGVAHPVPVLPDHRTRLELDGAIAGESAAQSQELRSTLVEAFQRTAWWSPSGVRSAHASIDGNLQVGGSSRDVTLTASWTEQVPYTDYETTQESYQEPYDDTESYSEEVPSTEYRTETVPCGDTTCTNTVPDTVYHTEWKTRTVTKYRTAYRDVTTPVTHYRDVPRAQDYNAIERHATYQDELHVRTGDGLPALDITVEKSTSESGYDHDVTIDAAGVSPSRANLTTQSEFAATEQARLAQRAIAALDEAYVQRFCTQPAFTLERAAECAYAGAAKLPAAARAVLHEAFGGDEPFLDAITPGR